MAKNVPMKPWEDLSRDEMADEAEAGTRGQGSVVETNWRLMQAIERFNKNSGKQAETMIRLTRWIIFLTWLLGGIAALQFWLMWRGRA